MSYPSIAHPAYASAAGRRHAVALTRVAIFPLLAALASCGGGEAPDPATAEAAKGLTAREVALVTPERRELAEEIRAIGSLLPFEEVPVAADLEGPVDRVMVEVGDRVAAGQPLLAVDRATFELRLAQAEAQLAQARAQAEVATRELQRKAKLLADQTISQARFDVVEGEAELARAQVAAAEAARDLAARDLDKSLLRAPFAGMVAQRMVERGQRVGVGEPLLRIANVGRLRLRFDLPERHAGRIQQIRSVQFTTPGSDRSHGADRWAIAPILDTATRTATLTFVVDNRDGRLQAGASATVAIAFPEKVVRWIVPRAAVTLEELPRVFVAEDGVARERVVTLGRLSDDEAEIVSGVDSSTRVIADARGMYEGVPVTTTPGANP
jgi:RND family efflux transporter MFP subunit